MTDTAAVERQRVYDLAAAYLLVLCPRCKASIGLQCSTDTGFYNGAGGPHAGRRKAVAHMTETEILDAWAARRAERAASRAEWEAIQKARHHTTIVGPNPDGLYGWSCACGDAMGAFFQPSYAITSAEKHGPLVADSPRPSNAYGPRIRAQVSGPGGDGCYGYRCPEPYCPRDTVGTGYADEERALLAAYDHRRFWHHRLPRNP
jgi:hypothetical protein